MNRTPSEIIDKPEENNFSVEWEQETGGRYWKDYDRQQDMYDDIEKAKKARTKSMPKTPTQKSSSPTLLELKLKKAGLL